MSDRTKEQNICYCGNYGGGMHTRSARCPGGELRTLQGEPALTRDIELPGTREPVVTAPKGNAGESPASISSNERVLFERYILTERGQDYLQRNDPRVDAEHDYVNDFVQEAWEAWQARAGMRSVETSPPIVECHDRMSLALEEICDLKVTAPSPLGALHGAGMTKGFEIAADIAKKALAQSCSPLEPSDNESNNT